MPEKRTTRPAASEAPPRSRGRGCCPRNGRRPRAGPAPLARISADAARRRALRWSEPRRTVSPARCRGSRRPSTRWRASCGAGPGRAAGRPSRPLRRPARRSASATDPRAGRPARAAAGRAVRSASSPSERRDRGPRWARDGSRRATRARRASLAPMRNVSRAASSEWPPSAKKSSWTPTAAGPAARPQTSARAGLDGVARGTRSCPSFGAAGARQRARSSLPLGVSGKASSATNAAGTMYSGRRACAGARAARSARRRRAGGDDVGHQPLVAGRVLARDAPPPRARPGAAPARPRSRPARCGSRGSSPGSRCGPGTRWCRRRSQRAEVAGLVQARAGRAANGSATKRSAVSSGAVQVAARHAARRRCTARPARRPAPGCQCASST